MANVSFVRTDSLTPNAKIYLEQASEAMGGYYTVNMAIAEEKAAIGAFYNVHVENELYGCFFLRYRAIDLGKIMEIVLLGGREMHAWSSQLVDFLKRIAREQKADEITVVGRMGWGKLFHDLERMSCFYRFIVNG